MNWRFLSILELDDGPLKFGHLIIAVRDYDFEDGKTRE